MGKASGDGGPRGPDLLAVVLLGLLAVAAIGAIFAVVHAGYMTAGAVIGVITVGGAFALVHSAGNRTPPPKNTFVHGAARTATEAEAKAAARGDLKTHDLNKRIFPE